MTYREEFPDFVLDVELPAGFEDRSWRNDVTPCFIDETRGLCLWVDYADHADRREFAANRFVLTRVDAEGQHTDDEPLLETDDYAEVLAFIKK